MSATDPPEHSRQRVLDRSTGHRPASRQWWLVVPIGAVGLVLSVVVWWLLLAGERRSIKDQFQIDAGYRLGAVRESFANHMEVASALKVFYGASKLVERDEFRAFTEPSVTRHPGIQALAWVPRVDDARRAEHERATQQEEGYGDYQITELGAEGKLIPAAGRKEYFPVHFLEPGDCEAVKLGYDLGSNASFRTAIKWAREQGRMAPAGQIEPVGDQEGPRGYFVLVPIYRKGASQDTIEDRVENLDGFVLAVCQIGAVVEDAIAQHGRVGMYVYLSTRPYPEVGTLIHSQSDQPGKPAPDPPTGLDKDKVAQVALPLDVPNAALTVWCTPDENYAVREKTLLPLAALLIGIVITALSAACVIAWIGRRYQVEEAIWDTASRYRALFESTGDAIMLLDERGFIECNEATLKLFGCSTREEIISKHPSELSPLTQPDGTDSRTAADARIAAALEEGTTRFEWLHRRSDGTDFMADVLLTSIQLKDREILQAVVRDITESKQAEWVLRDAHDKLEQRVQERTAELAGANEDLKREIAERQRAEESIRDSEALYSSLVENLPIQMLRKDLEGRFIFANQAFCTLLGKPLEEIVGKTDFDFYPPELAEKFRGDDRRVVETGELFETVEENKQDGKSRFVQVMKSAVRDAGDRIIGVQVIFWDVTERKKAETALEQERYLLHALMDNVPHNIYFKDAQSRFVRINKALAGCFGLKDSSEALGKTDFDFFTEEHARPAMEDEQEIIRTGQPLVDKEEKETWLDGHDTWASTTKLPLYDEEGRIVGTFGISRDVTVQKQAAEALREAKEAAESASRAKSDFLANMSHEIRTPMNAIIGLTDLVLDTELDASQREYLIMARESSESLMLVINDVLDFSKIEAGKLDLERAPFDLPESLGDTMKSLAVRAHAKGLELACQIRPDVPTDLLGDVGRLRQVVVNLVGNAIKFTDQGEVVLEVACESRSEDAAVLHFSVTDTGIGIPEKKLATIFQAFEQVDNTMTRRFGGTGLGLAISSRLVEFMDGRMWVESEVGRGTTFHFTTRLGLVDGKPAPVRPAEATQIRGLRTLVVDDNATNRRIMEEMLRNWEMEPTTASGAHEALQLMREAQEAGRSYPLVLTDANMPEMDGFTLAEHIKQDKELGSTIIMMLTSGDRPGDVARCEQLGVAAYLLKPVKQSELFDAITMALGITAAEEESEEVPGGEQPQRLRPLRILLAEDSLVNQKLAVGLLERAGHTVVVADHGKEALAAWQSQTFDLVLMDVQMPEMDGLEATAAIRAREKRSGAHTPIIAMTAHVMKGDRERCLEAGMDEYIAKPIRPKRVFDTIEAVLRTTTESPARPEPSSRDEEETLDWSEALQAMKGDRDLLKVVVEAFLEESPRLMTEIRQAVAESDAAVLRRAAHTLKGSMRYFGPSRASACAHRLEKMGQAGSLGDAEQALAALEEQMARLGPVLLDYQRGVDAHDES